jgi:hypothetical protein
MRRGFRRNLHAVSAVIAGPVNLNAISGGKRRK